jgi:L-rhamnose mutarotase
MLPVSASGRDRPDLMPRKSFVHNALFAQWAGALVLKNEAFISDTETAALARAPRQTVPTTNGFTARNRAVNRDFVGHAGATSRRISFVIRKAFRMAVDPGSESEYERRHRPVWPELEAALVRHGVRSYSIFLDSETNDLFGYVEVECEEQWNAIASTDVCRRWWRHMRDLMPTNADSSPVSRDLREVFHLGVAGC